VGGRESACGRSGKGRKREEPPVLDDQVTLSRANRVEIKKKKYIEKEAPRRASFNVRTMSGERMWHGRKWDARRRIHEISELSLLLCVRECVSLYWHLILIHGQHAVERGGLDDR
jgi:hypothetical protein